MRFPTLFCRPLVSLCVTITLTTAAIVDAATPTAREHGAVGDGVADDRAALQAAIDRGEGGVVIEPGVYRITGPILVDLATSGFTSVTGTGAATIYMDGPGPAFRFIGNHTGTASPPSVPETVWNRERTPNVSGIEIVGKHPEADGIELDGTMQPIISRVTVREARHGIRLINRNRNVIVTACHLYDNSGVGIYLDKVNLHQIVIGDTHVSYNDGGGVVIRGGNVRNVHIGNCDLEANMPPDDTPSKAANVLVDVTDREGSELDNRYADTIAELTISGSTLQHTGKNTSSANVRLLGRDDYPINTVAITGNVMSDVNCSIDADYISGTTITGNVFFTGKPTDIRIKNSQRLVLANNQFDPRRYEGARSQEGGVHLLDCHDLTINGLQFSAITNTDPALWLTRCERVVLTGCQLYECTNGLRLEDCRTVLLGNNMISGIAEDGYALDATGTSDMQLGRNVIRGRERGIAP